MSRSANAAPDPLRIGVGLVAAVILVLVGAGLIALAGLGRLTDDLDPLRAPAWFWYYRGDPLVRRWLSIGLAAVSTPLTAILLAVALSRRPPLHGAADWATSAQIRAAGLRGREGVLLGHARGGGMLVSEGPEHVIVYAPTRTGKGVGVVIPNLLAWSHSAVVLDIKRENFAATAGYRADHGQTILLFDPLAPDGRTARFNPLGHVSRDVAAEVLDELQRMAVMLFPAPEHADPFWSEAARTGFIGVGAYVAATPPLPFSLGEIFRQLTNGDPRQRFPRIIAARRRDGDPLPSACVSALNDFCSASENTFASIRQSITSRMGLWLNPAVDAATDQSDFDLRDLREGQMTLYLGATPDNLLRVAPLYSLVFQQLVDLNSRRLPEPQERPVLVILDEFARLGPAPVLAHAFSWVAGYGLRLLPVIQSPSQLRALYGPDLAESIMTNCGVEVVFAPKELKVAQELSERLGTYTYKALSRSRPMGLGAGRRTLTASDQRRALRLPQELSQMSSRTLLVFRAGLPPVRGRKIVYYRERVFRDRLRPPPPVAARARAVVPPASPLDDPGPDALDFDTIARRFAAEGCAPPPPGASEQALEAWIDRVLTAEVAVRESVR